MRIVLLNDDSLPTATGGAAVIVENLRKAYAKHGHEVTLITTHQDSGRPEIERRKDDAGAVISLRISYPKTQRHRKCLGMPDVSAKLKELMSEFRPDIVHAHNVHAYLTYDALRVAHQAGAKIFLTAHDSFLVAFNRVNSSAYRRSVLRGTPYVMRWWDHLLSVGRRYWPFRNAEIKRALHDSGTKVIAISHAGAKFLAAHGVDVVTAIPNGIELTTPAPSQKHPPTILYCGRINADKGIRQLLDAFVLVKNHLPDARLTIVGDAKRTAPFVDPLPADVRSAIRMTGIVNRNELPSLYASSDVVAVPSIYLDTFPTVALEAMNAEKPIVGSPYGGIPEIVEDGGSGLIADPMDPDVFATALKTLLTDEALAARMGQNGKARLVERFTLERQVEHYLWIFENENSVGEPSGSPMRRS